MLLLIMIALALLVLFYVLQDHSRTALFICGIYVGLILLIFSYILIWTKNGGIQATAQFALFLLPSARSWLLYLPISASQMSWLLLAGKSLFLCSAMLLAAYIRQSSSRGLNIMLYSIAILPPALNLLLLNPWVYSSYCGTDFFRANQTGIFNLIRSCYVICLSFCIYLMVKRYTLVRIGWIKRQIRQVIWSSFCCYLLFILLGVLGPIQVSDFTGIQYITANFLYMGGRLPWLIITVGSVGLTLVGSKSLIEYSRISRQIGKPDITIDKKLKDSNASVRMFTHGMKNQLLVMRTMLRNLQQEVQLSEEAATRVREIDRVSQAMVERMDELYRAFKDDAMKLSEVQEPFEIMETAQKKLGNCAVLIQADCIEQQPILADAPHLSEAVYNILKNAVDAIQSKPDPKQELIAMRMYIDHNSVVFEVRDTGEGIAQKNLHRIFEPFYTSRNSKTNWGIGLSYVQQVVKGHGGQLSIDSKLGVGTTIYLTVPAYRKL